MRTGRRVELQTQPPSGGVVVRGHPHPAHVHARSSPGVIVGEALHRIPALRDAGELAVYGSAGLWCDAVLSVVRVGVTQQGYRMPAGHMRYNRETLEVRYKGRNIAEVFQIISQPGRNPHSALWSFPSM